MLYNIPVSNILAYQHANMPACQPASHKHKKAELAPGLSQPE